MGHRIAAVVAGLVVGFAGVLIASAIRPSGGPAFAAALAVGVLAGAFARRPIGLVGLVLGIGLAYPAALILGLMVFLGEAWYIAFAFIVCLASIGFGAVVLGLRGTIARGQSG
jgi:hypothetical protein